MAITVSGVERIDGQLVRPDQPLAVGLASTVHVHEGAGRSTPSTGPTALARGSASMPIAWARPATPATSPASTLPRRSGQSARCATRCGACWRLRSPATRRGRTSAPSTTRPAPPSRHAELRWPAGGHPSATSVTPAGPVPALVGLLAADGIVVLGGAHGPVRACEAPSCVLYFVRTHPRQEWCSPSCGNRARVARHYRATCAGHGGGKDAAGG